LKRWQQHLIPLGDVNTIARPEFDSIAALLSDKAEAIPLDFEDPPFVVEWLVDERREHRSISGIHVFSYALAGCVDAWKN
jgi:hypothetical protein